MKFALTTATIGFFIATATTAWAQDSYISGSVGLNLQADSNNAGTTGAFTTGNLGDGSTLDVASGTDYGWDTAFENGWALSGEFGRRYGNGLRLGIEAVYSKADVDTHTNVNLGGGSIDSVDAAAVAGSPTALGVTVADVVADGQGDISQFGAFVNAYYDFETGSNIQPYLGAGIGVADVDVTYSPSGIAIIDDGGSKFAYQGKAGITIRTNSPLEYFGEYTYRATSDIEVNNDLFPGILEIENKQSIVSVGARYSF